jgi:hypothetical protein
LRQDDAPVCAQTSTARSSGSKNESDAGSEGEREDVLRSAATAPTTAKPKKGGGLARRNLTTELESADLSLGLSGKKGAKAKPDRLVVPATRQGTATKRRKESENEDGEREKEERKRRAAEQALGAKALTTAAAPRARRELARGDFEVVMLVDTREIAGKGNKDQGKGRKTIFQELSKRGIACEERSLALGDFLWIARDKRRGSEYVMDVIVERKKVDDLWASIKDGRYYEQKVYY